MTPEEMKADWLNFILSRDHQMQDTSEYTYNAMLAEAVAAQFWTFVQLLKQKVLDGNPMTATGAALSALVLDRLPAGRYPGTRATGALKFSRPTISTVEYSIPSGTIVSTNGEGGTVAKFETIANAVLAAGQLNVSVAARAINIGVEGNAPANTVVAINTPVYGINAVTNELPFDNGTTGETDIDLRLRYIYTVWEEGKATKPMMEAHIDAIDVVRQVSVTTVSNGDMLIVVDSTGGAEAGPEEIAAIQAEIADNRASGTTSPGMLGATLRPGGHVFELGDCSGGKVWFRAREYIAAPTTVPFTYTNQDDESAVGAINVPAGTAEGQNVLATLADPADLAKAITASSYAGGISFDIYMALGEYPDCWVAPELQPVDVVAVLVLTASAEAGLVDSITASVNARISAYRVGEPVHHAELYRCLWVDHATNRPFEGLHDVPVMTVTCKGETVGFGQTVTLETDERAEVGDLDGITDDPPS